MPYSYSQTTGDGSTNVLSVPFLYLRQSDVHVFVAGEETSGFSWLTPSTLQLTAGAGTLAGKALLVKRVTPIVTPNGVFVAGGLDQRALNAQVQQLLYALQESIDFQQALATNVGSTAVRAFLDSLPSSPDSLLSGGYWMNGGIPTKVL